MLSAYVECGVAKVLEEGDACAEPVTRGAPEHAVCLRKQNDEWVADPYEGEEDDGRALVLEVGVRDGTGGVAQKDDRGVRGSRARLVEDGRHDA